MNVSSEILLGVMALLGSAGVGGMAVKLMNRSVDSATAEKLHEETRAQAKTSAQTEVDTIRAVMAELRNSESLKTGEIAELKADMKAMKDRVGKLEERERHMLTRAAVHEAWDQMAFAALLAMNPNHPPPPPIVPVGYLTSGEIDEDEDD